MNEIKRRINGDSFNFRLREASGIVLGARPRCRARAPRRLGASKTPRRPRPRTPSKAAKIDEDLEQDNVEV